MTTVAKTLQGRGAILLAAFAARQPAVFTIDEAARELGVEHKAAGDLLWRLARLGWLVRHRVGVYEIAPIWATAESPAAAPRFASLSAWVPRPFYVGFLSAFEIHGWLRQPVVGRIILAVDRQQRATRSGSDRITWVVLRPDAFAWGITTRWIDGAEVRVSDPERTIVDGLHLPRHIGGVAEIADALVGVFSRLDQDQLLDYVERVANTSVARRLGWMIETTGVPGGAVLAEQLRASLPSGRTVALLDPSQPAMGSIDRRWGLRLNIEAEDIKGAGRT